MAPNSRLVKWGGRIRVRKRATRRFFRRKVNRVMAAVRRWGEKLRRLRLGPGSGYARLGRVREERPAVPKGHVAVYVGRKEEEVSVERERVVVPVIYVNHPLFGRLLREAEEKYGYDHPGGITLPCHVAEVESVQSMIAAMRKSSHGWY